MVSSRQIPEKRKKREVCDLNTDRVKLQLELTVTAESASKTAQGTKNKKKRSLFSPQGRNDEDNDDKSQRVTLALGQQRATRVSVSPCPPPSTGTYCAVIPIARRRTSTSERLTRKKEHPQTPTRDRYSMFRRVGLLTRVRVLPYPCQHQYQYHTSRVRRAVSTYVRINVGLGGLGRPRINVKLARGCLRGGIVSYIPYAYHTIHLCCQFPGQPIERTSLPFQLGGRSEGPALLLLLFQDLT